MSTAFAISLANGAAFTASPGETILAAAQRAHWLIRYGCRNGNCAVCEATLITGAVLQRGEIIESTDTAPKILLCQCSALSDLRIKLDRDPIPGSTDNSQRIYARLIGSIVSETNSSANAGINCIRLEFFLPAGRMPAVLAQQHAVIETDSGALQLEIDSQLTSARKLIVIAAAEPHLIIGQYYHVRYPFGSGNKP